MTFNDGIITVDYNIIQEEYRPQDNIFLGTPDIFRVLSELSEEDRRYLILYAETGSSRKAAQVLNTSKDTVCRRITEIKKHFKKQLC